MTERSDSWTKWWWLGYFGVQTWTAEERRVRIAPGMSALVAVLVVELIADALFEWVGVERHIAAILAGLISIVPGFFSARPIAAVLYADQLRIADLNAKKRLSMKADK
jgi:hypothetical protein